MYLGLRLELSALIGSDFLRYAISTTVFPSILRIGKALGQQEYLSMTVSKYVNPIDVGSGPTKSTCIRWNLSVDILLSFRILNECGVKFLLKR